MSALEQSFADIVAKHDLTSFEVRRLCPGGDYRGRAWSATAHWKGFTNTGHYCCTAYGDTLADAVAECLFRAAKDRVPLNTRLADEPLPVGEAA